MQSKYVFIYDGECPFCNQFAELLELKSGIPNLSILNGRENLEEINILYRQGFDIDKGAILKKGDEILHGASAIHWICSQIKEPSNSLLKILTITFMSKWRTSMVFPLLLFARRSSLFFKGVSNKLVN